MNADSVTARSTEADRQVSDSYYRETCEFLFREARLLDANKLREWLAFLAPDFHYRLVAPTVAMTHPSGETASAEVLLMDENISSLKVRIKQLTTPALTLADNPHSFTRRFVSNVLIEPLTGDLIRVYSNALIYRSRGSGEQHLFSTTRIDEIRRENGELLLVSRMAQLDEAIVGARNIASIF